MNSGKTINGLLHSLLPIAIVRRFAALGGCFALLLVVGVASSPLTAADDTIRAGIIGCDTSHVIAFTDLFNAPDADESLANVKVVAAFPGGSHDIASSRDRVGKFTEKLRDKGIQIVDSVDTLVDLVDVVLLESVDGRKHLEQVRPVFASGKRVFIDKPIAASLADTIEIADLSKESGVPFFSCSAIRFTPGISSARTDPKLGQITGCATYSPCPVEPTHPDLYWYGVHGVEALFTIMGPDCERVTRTQTEDTELVVGVWGDGLVGTFRGIRKGRRDYGALLFREKSNVFIEGFGGYEPLVKQIAQFFKTGVPPVSAEETIAIIAFMDAADESKRQGGMPVTIESVMARAKAEVADRK
ncbi:hypothetical protein HG15A2_37470 [Adhaeretor mobilis]|uniref:Gfo/Idh/MocA-like oxidoreductase N-terminal domain-containing protein n=1 Tax=Adhaeretor mobilis TaxID=1930276 RepID=A0A517MZU9_9BACT|nr:hypothetical protein HG15A2_37470 [Adhaeretor mobilis]